MSQPEDAASRRSKYILGFSLMLTALVIHQFRGSFEGYVALAVGLLAWTVLGIGAIMVGSASVKGPRSR